MRSSESKGATMFKLSISLRTRAKSACFCHKSSHASFIALLSQYAVALFCEAYIFIYFLSTRSALVSESRTFYGRVMDWGESGYVVVSCRLPAQSGGRLIGSLPGLRCVSTGVRVAAR